MALIEKDIIEHTSDAWNVAQGYTALKILKPLVEMDKLVKIAVYGCENPEQTIEINQQPDIKTMCRIDAISRLIDCLKELFENSEFAMKRKLTPERLTKLQDRVTAVENVMNGITRETIDMRTNEKQIQINEEHFRICLNELREIKKEIPKPLNENSLIFPTSEEVDFDAIKKNIIEAG
jgi:hypothetical protein